MYDAGHTLVGPISNLYLHPCSTINQSQLCLSQKLGDKNQTCLKSAIKSRLTFMTGNRFLWADNVC